VSGSTISLGLSQALNLSTNRSHLSAWNNVFNPLKGQKATIKYEIQSAGHVTIKLYTLSGTLISTLLDGDFSAGKGSVDWDGRNLISNTVASGIYLVHMKGPGISKTQKIAVVK
jgi:flagellar hook assembly protein FlgD